MTSRLLLFSINSRRPRGAFSAEAGFSGRPSLATQRGARPPRFDPRVALMEQGCIRREGAQSTDIANTGKPWKEALVTV